MSKNKKSQQQKRITEVKVTPDVSLTEETNEVVVAKETTEDKQKNEKKNDKKELDKKGKNNKKNVKKKEKGKLKRKAKESISELKKVVWPTFGEVCKKTGVVLVVVLVFAVVIFGIDYGLGSLIGLLKK